jgi:DNA/RNA-binding domain of Phe-tRNA-synthetase-like protein
VASVWFQHNEAIWRDFPELAAGVLYAEGPVKQASIADRVAVHTTVAASRLGSDSESALPEIQAWRRAFSRMGLKPTQYRCASEALLRRFRREGDLPSINPVIDICNAVSVAFAVPIAVFDVEHISDWLEVRYSAGDETYQTFGGDIETPEPGEVVFADAAGRAHARRWTNRQSALSAVGHNSTSVLVVAEALHDTAAGDVERLVATVADELQGLGLSPSTTAVLSAASPRYEL